VVLRSRRRVASRDSIRKYNQRGKLNQGNGSFTLCDFVTKESWEFFSKAAYFRMVIDFHFRQETLGVIIVPLHSGV
jgi:hypothetical protein